MLLTPTANLAYNGGSQPPAKRKAGGHGPTLADQIEHLFPTPRASDGPHGSPLCTGTGLPPLISRLFPTPAAGNFNDGEGLASWEAKRAVNLAKGINGNGQGTPLPIALQKLFPTPAGRDWKGISLRGMGSVRPDTGRLRTARQVDLPAAVSHLTGKSTSQPSAAGSR